MPSPITVGELRRAIAGLSSRAPVTIHRFTGPHMQSEDFYISHSVSGTKRRCVIAFDDRNTTSDPYSQPLEV